MWTKGRLNKVWQRHAGEILAQIPCAELARGDKRIMRLLDTLTRSPLGYRLADHAKRSGIAVMFDPEIGKNALGFYYPDVRIVILSPQADDNALIGAIAHEFRHAWQDSRGLMINSVMVNPLDYLVKSRLIEADATACQLQVLAELSARMIRGPWRGARDNPEFFAGDCLQAFRNHMTGGSGNLASYGAMGKAFEEWFKSGVKQDYDMMNLNDYTGCHKEIHKDSQNPSHETLMEAGGSLLSRILQVCGNELSDNSQGIAYRQKRVFESLGDMLDGQSYIKGVIREYMKIDAIFGVPDTRKNLAAFKKAEKLYQATLAIN